MLHLFRDHPEACDNTLLIAERADVQFNTNANYMPRFPVPEGESEESWFVKEVDRGLAVRYPNGIPAEVRKQADYEVGVILQMGFPGYFLVVADFINWSKNNGIRVGVVQRAELPTLAVALVVGVEDLLERDVLAHDGGRHRLGDPVPHRERVAEDARGVLDPCFALLVPEVTM